MPHWIGFYLGFKGSTEFYWVLSRFTGFPLDSLAREPSAIRWASWNGTVFNCLGTELINFFFTGFRLALSVLDRFFGSPRGIFVWKRKEKDNGRSRKGRKKNERNEKKTKGRPEQWHRVRPRSPVSSSFLSFFLFFSPQFVRLSFAEFFRFLLGVYCLLGLTRFYWVLLDFTGIYFVSLGFIGSNWVWQSFIKFDRVLLEFPGFYCVSLGFTGSNLVLQSLLVFTGFYCVPLGFIGSNWVLQSFTKFDRVLLSFTTGFHWDLFRFIGFYWV